MTLTAAALRRQMQRQRRSLSKAEQQQAAVAAAEKLLAWRRWQSVERVGLYKAVAGELDPEPLARLLQQRGAKLYYPRLHGEHKMHFIADQGGWKKNRFGIEEPLGHDRIHARFLTLMICPLTAFDKYGNRLGMGGGYYDRLLHHYSQPSAAMGTQLIGYGYSFQQHSELAARPWDVAMNCIATETGVLVSAPLHKS